MKSLSASVSHPKSVSVKNRPFLRGGSLNVLSLSLSLSLSLILSADSRRRFTARVPSFIVWALRCSACIKECMTIVGPDRLSAARGRFSAFVLRFVVSELLYLSIKERSGVAAG